MDHCQGYAMFVHVHYYKYSRERNNVHTYNYAILSTFALIQRSLCTPLQCNIFVHRHRYLILCARTADPAHPPPCTLHGDTTPPIMHNVLCRGALWTQPRHRPKCRQTGIICCISATGFEAVSRPCLQWRHLNAGLVIGSDSFCHIESWFWSSH